MLGRFFDRHAFLATSLLPLLLLHHGFVEAAPDARSPWILAGRQDDTPCARVSAAWTAQTAINATIVPEVDGQLAYDCLNSVALGVDDAVKLVHTLQLFSEWQSTVAYLRDPPKDYPFPAFDLDAAFETILSNVQNGVYGGEYEFQADLFRTYNLAKDGHFSFRPDLLTGAISFRRGNLSLVSVSLDGVSVPEIYVLSDIRAYNQNNSFVPSPIRFLNGSDAAPAIANLSLLGVLQDPDALYNHMFYSPGMYAANKGQWQGYFGGSGRFGYIWPGPSTDVTFANGTTVNYRTVARIIGDFSDISDGASFYAKYCSGAVPVTQVATPIPTPTPTATPVAGGGASTQASMTTTTTTATPTEESSPPEGNLTAPAPLGYPQPVVIASDHSVAGYYLPDTDVAVLSLLTYQADIPREFQRTVEVFIERAVASGKTKLIIDLSANGGGFIFQAHDTFRQLFPHILQDGYNRHRSSELLRVSAQQFSAVVPPGFDPLTSDNETLIDMRQSYYNYHFDVNRTNQKYPAFEAKYGTSPFYGDNFTQIQRWDLDDPLLTINETWGIGFEVTGYGTRQNFTQPFAAQDIILVYDGFCASTCSIFSEFLRVQAGVRSVTFGGRPDLDASGAIPNIQNYGGTRGSQNIGFFHFPIIANYSLYIQGSGAVHPTSGPVGPLPEATVAFLERNLDTYAANRSTDNSLNLRDNILRDHLADGLPAQFLQEPTDCRLFYTPQGIDDPVAQWRQAAEAAWGSGGCVAGPMAAGTSTGQKLKRGVEGLTPEQRRRALETGTVVSLPHDNAPLRDEMWKARHGMSVPI